MSHIGEIILKDTLEQRFSNWETFFVALNEILKYIIHFVQSNVINTIGLKQRYKL